MKPNFDFELDEEEKEILEAFEKGEFVSVPNQEEERREAIEAATNTLNRKKRITVSLAYKDILNLEKKIKN